MKSCLLDIYPCAISYGRCALLHAGMPLSHKTVISDMTHSMTQICPMCSSKDVKAVSLPYPLFRHMDFAIFHPGPFILGSCNKCQLTFRVTGYKEQKNIDAIYRSVEYRKNKKPHTVVVNEYKEPATMPFLQAELLRPYLPIKNPAVLDIGCYDGKLLFEIGKNYENADLCGFDVAERPQFPQGRNFRFLSGKIEHIEGCFDLVVMSHSMQYILNIQFLFEQIRKRLKPDGKLFVQVPNFFHKPCSLLLGDLYYHYTPTILGNIFSQMEFKYKFIESQSFPRDILAISQPSEKKEKMTSSDDNQLFECIRQIGEFPHKIKKFKEYEKIGIFGTTIEAAFANYCFSERASYFVDENPDKIGITFNGKHVFHPESVKEEDTVIIPMGDAGIRIGKRLSAKYKGNYVCF